MLLGDAALVHQANAVHGVDSGPIDAADVIHQADVHEQQLVGAVVDADAVAPFMPKDTSKMSHALTI